MLLCEQQPLSFTTHYACLPQFAARERTVTVNLQSSRERAATLKNPPKTMNLPRFSGDIPGSPSRRHNPGRYSPYTQHHLGRSVSTPSFAVDAEGLFGPSAGPGIVSHPDSHSSHQTHSSHNLCASPNEDVPDPAQSLRLERSINHHSLGQFRDDIHAFAQVNLSL